MLLTRWINTIEAFSTAPSGTFIDIDLNNGLIWQDNDYGTTHDWSSATSYKKKFGSSGSDQALSQLSDKITCILSSCLSLEGTFGY